MKNQVDENGERHGLWEMYYSNGDLIYRCVFNHGIAHGIFEWYYSGRRPEKTKRRVTINIIAKTWLY